MSDMEDVLKRAAAYGMEGLTEKALAPVQEAEVDRCVGAEGAEVAGP